MKLKKIVSLLLLIIVITISCKEDSEKKTSTKEDKTEAKLIKKYRGEFIHVDTAAVLKGANFIYGVKMNTVAKDIIKQVDTMKKDEYDVINIEVAGQLQPNDQEGWEEIIVIESIEKLYPPKPEKETKVLKYSSKKTE